MLAYIQLSSFVFDNLKQFNEKKICLKRILINKCKKSNCLLFVLYLVPFEFDTMNRKHVTLT